MNEEDIMKKIKEECNNLPVPESLSPENMEKMLNEHIEKSGNLEDNNTKKYKFSNAKKFGLAIAACFGVIIIGSGAYEIINRNQNYDATAPTDKAAIESVEENNYDEDYAKEQSDEAVENTAVGSNTDEDENAAIEKDLVASGTLNKPSSYEDYYNTIYDASQDEIKRYKGMQKATPTEASDNHAIMEDSVEYVEEASDNEASYETNDAASSGAEVSRSLDASSSSTKTDGAKNFSQTNTQEMTVDEGDVVKTDGNYIYSINLHGYYWYAYDSQAPVISITKANNGKLSKMSSIELTAEDKSDDTEYYFKEFYIYKNYLVVMSEKSSIKKSQRSRGLGKIFDSDSYYPYTVKQTCIDIYDISNKSKPKKYKTLYQSGSYNSSRVSDGFLYTISYFTSEVSTFYDRKKGIDDYEGYIPYINDDAISCEDIYYSRHLDSMGTYVITSVNLNSPKSFSDSKAVSNSNGTVYVSDSAIYMYSTIYDRIEKTEIMKVAYDKGSLYIGNRAVIAGYLYGTFALSEYDNYLRIVSTIPQNDFSWYDNQVWSDDIAKNYSQRIAEDINAVYVLDDNMKLTGRITGLAPGEQIYSARFFGNIGYFVTYRNTDPLFSVDFSNPKEPKILGALKIPGFSNYLHFYGNDTLLGIGEETDPYTQEFLGLKLSMFDISDPSNVTESDKFVIKDTYYSSAQYNHKSIMIDPAKNVFGFCYECNEVDGYDGYYYNYYYSTYTYDKEKGFVETARYKILYDYMYNIEDVRGIYIGNIFYLVTPDNIQSYRLGDQKQIDNIFLE
ncbi:MAG: beta-propeller domain-containing protein [Lachnospiraceae bacterium]|nr:beta-propeller domain-containing protein [Lachnospiraceae bacterium]